MDIVPQPSSGPAGRPVPLAASAAAPTQELPALSPPPPAPPPQAPRPLAPTVPPALRALARPGGLAFVAAVSAVLNIHRLAQNGYANVFYSAGVKSMLVSLHNFLFVSFDPGGLISVDKPPLALWVQVGSAKVFGFSPMSLLLPEAIIGVLSVCALYLIVARRLGTWAALAAGLALALFPSFVAVSRDNGVDPLLILLMTLACGAALRACERGRLRWLLVSALMVGLAFNTKTLAAYLVVPGIAAGFLFCAPGSVLSRIAKLLAAGVVMVAISFAWIAYVELTPASQRPYVGGSTNNTELGLTFGYNGFGRVEGQEGGPNDVKVKPGARLPTPPLPSAATARGRALRAKIERDRTRIKNESHETFLINGRYRNPIPFGSRPSPVRLFGKGLGDQDGWQIPFALFGLFALMRLGYLVLRRRISARGAAEEAVALDASLSLGTPLAAAQPAGAQPPAGADPAGPPRAGSGPLASWRELLAAPGRQLRRAGQLVPLRRRSRTGADVVPAGPRSDPRLAVLLVLGGWFVVEAAVLSLSKGIVHPYYVSALGPGTAAMMGAGAVAIVALRRRRGALWAVVLAAAAVAGTVAVQIVLLERESYLHWFIPILAGVGILGVVMLASARALAAPAMALLVALTLVVPAAYSKTTWTAPVEGTFPAAGPKFNAGPGGLGVSARSITQYRALASYALSHDPGRRWLLLVVASDTAAPMILLGHDVAAIGGYSGTDPSLDGPGLARLVREGLARYVVLGGAYSTRGGNLATQAALKACPVVPPARWHDPYPFPGGLGLVDCGGRASALQHG